MKTNINQFPKFKVEHEFSKINQSSDLFFTEKEAVEVYEKVASEILSDTNRLDSYHWRENREGLSVNISKLQFAPKEEIDEILAEEDEEEQDKMWAELVHTYSTIFKTKYTFLSDEWDEALGKNGEFVIKENEIEGATYSTLPFSKECINLETGETVVMKGAIE